MRHRRTDPACKHHRPPRGRITMWWFKRGHGKSCQRCMFAARIRSAAAARAIAAHLVPRW